MIKIIKEGKIENYKFKKTCSVCGCEFEYELKDLQKDYDYSMCLATYPPQYSYSRYVNCPCCGERVFHDNGYESRSLMQTATPCSITNNRIDHLDCDTCLNKPDPNNPVFGDTPCTLCKKMTPSCK